MGVWKNAVALFHFIAQVYQHHGQPLKVFTYTA